MSEDEKVLKIEEGQNFETEKGESVEKGENLEQIAEKTKILAAEVIERGNDFRAEIKNRKAREEIIEEFDNGEKSIEDEAKNAASLIIKDNNMRSEEGLVANEGSNEALDTLKEKFDKLFDGVIEEVNSIKASGESSDEKLARLNSLHEKMSNKYINEEGFNEYNQKSQKWREAGNTLYEAENEINNEKFEDKLADLKKQASDLEKAPIDSSKRIEETEKLLELLNRIVNEISISGEKNSIKKYPEIRDIGNLLYSIQDKAKADKEK